MSNLWDIAKALLIKKSVAPNAYLTEREKIPNQKLRFHMKNLEKQEQNKPKQMEGIKSYRKKKKSMNLKTEKQ